MERSVRHVPDINVDVIWSEGAAPGDSRIGRFEARYYLY